MRAGENQRVDTALLETAQVSFPRHLAAPVVSPAFLDQRHEERTGPAVDLDPAIGGFEGPGVGAALNGCLGADHADFPIPGAPNRSLNAGLDDADYRHRKFFPQMSEGDGRRRIARDDDDFDALLT